MSACCLVDSTARGGGRQRDTIVSKRVRKSAQGLGAKEAPDRPRRARRGRRWKLMGRRAEKGAETVRVRWSMLRGARTGRGASMFGRATRRLSHKARAKDAYLSWNPRAMRLRRATRNIPYLSHCE